MDPGLALFLGTLLACGAAWVVLVAFSVRRLCRALIKSRQEEALWAAFQDDLDRNGYG